MDVIAVARALCPRGGDAVQSLAPGTCPLWLRLPGAARIFPSSVHATTAVRSALTRLIAGHGRSGRTVRRVRGGWRSMGKTG